LEVLSGGALATVQDEGRPGAARHGVPRGGAMDRFALWAANLLLGNPPGAAAIEVTAGGAAFAVLRPTLLAVTGADLGATLGGAPLAPWTAALARKGAVLALPARRGGWGARAYLALGGGVDVPPVLGSRSTHLSGGFGGFQGRPLRPGDVIAAAGGGGDPLRAAGRRWPADARPAYGPAPLLRVAPGPHDEHFAPGALAGLAGVRLRVGASSNRMGYRLEGARLAEAGRVSLPSLGVAPGVIQVPPDGAPILLMADAQTTGGYPILGVVAAADLPLAAQLLPGDELRLAPVGREEAVAARRELAGWCARPFEADDDLLQLGLAGDLG
jgi:biotin-dependent carboxylase-like uncharacterized protein